METKRRCALVLAVLPLVVLAEGLEAVSRSQNELAKPNPHFANQRVARHLPTQLTTVTGELTHTNAPLYPHAKRRKSLVNPVTCNRCGIKKGGAKSSESPLPLNAKSPKISSRELRPAQESEESKENENGDILRILSRQKRAESFIQEFDKAEIDDQTTAEAEVGEEDEEEEEEEPAEELPTPEALRFLDPAAMTRQGIILEEVPSLANLFGLRFVRIKENRRHRVPNQGAGAKLLAEPGSPTWLRGYRRGSTRNSNRPFRSPSRRPSRLRQRAPPYTRHRRQPYRVSYKNLNSLGLTEDDIETLTVAGRHYRNQNLQDQQLLNKYPVRSKDEGFWAEIEAKYPSTNGYRGLTDLPTPFYILPHQSSSVPPSQRGRDPVPPLNYDLQWPHYPFIQAHENDLNLSEDLVGQNDHGKDDKDTGGKGKESEDGDEGGGGGITIPPLTQEELEKQFPFRNDLYVDELGNIYLKETENDDVDAKTTTDQLKTDGYEMYGLDPPEKVHSYNPFKDERPWPPLEPTRPQGRPSHFQKTLGKGSSRYEFNDFTNYQEGYSLFLQERPRPPSLAVDLPKENNYQPPVPPRPRGPTSTHRLRGKPRYSPRPPLVRPPPPRIPPLTPPSPGTRVISPNNFAPPDTRLVSRPVRPQRPPSAPLPSFNRHPQLYEDDIKHPHRPEYDDNYQKPGSSSGGRPTSSYPHFQGDVPNSNPYYGENRPPARHRGNDEISGFYPGNGFFNADLLTVFQMPSTYEDGLRATNKLG